MQGERERAKGQPGREAGTISWAEHAECFEAYAKRYGREQSCERTAQRGGFSWGEFVLFLGREPSSWQPL